MWLLLRHHGFLRGGVDLLLMPLRAAAQLLLGRPGRLRATRDGRDDAVGAVGPGTAHRALAAGGWELFVAREKVLEGCSWKQSRFRIYIHKKYQTLSTNKI